MYELPHKTGLAVIPASMYADQFLSLSGIEYEAHHIDLAVPALTGKVYLRWTTSATKYTITNFRQIITDQERSFYRVYGPSAFSGGTPGAPLSISKTRQDSPIDPHLVVVSLTSPTITGEASIVEPLFGQAGQGVIIATGGGTTEQSLRISPPGTVFLSEFENNSALATYYQLNIHWWEVSPQGMSRIQEI